MRRHMGMAMRMGMAYAVIICRAVGLVGFGYSVECTQGMRYGQSGVMVCHGFRAALPLRLPR
jgi:hypothetical protein